MATLILKDAYVEVNAVDLSDHAHQVQLDYSADEVEDTNFGDDTHLFMADTLKNWSLTITFAQDFASGSVDDTLFSLVGQATTVKLRPTTAVVGATNPEFSGTGVLLSYPPMGGSVGERLTSEAQFSAASDLTRATA